MSRPISLSRLKSASLGKQDDLLSELVDGARQPANRYADELEDRIAEYERRGNLGNLPNPEEYPGLGLRG